MFPEYLLQTVNYFWSDMKDTNGLKENSEVWGIAGLLYDLDFGETKDRPDIHTLKAAEILEER